MPLAFDIRNDMANQNPLRFDKPLTMRVDQEFLDLLDDLRRKGSPIPSRAEVIREAVEDMAKRKRIAR